MWRIRDKTLNIKSIITDIDFLRQVSKETTETKVKTIKLVEGIKYALKTGWVMGYGLAAIQIGIPIRAAWYCLKEEILLVNPKILEKRGAMVLPGEGCLSIPNKVFSVLRYNEIKFENNGRIFVAEGKEAQIIQHEVDHMNGILVCDREYKSSNIGRNDICLCGSGKKYKKCCLNK